MIFRSRSAPRARGEDEAALPDGMRIYAIGDIHGRCDLFERLLGEVRADLDARPCAKPIIALLGDYIDRGPESFGVVDAIARGAAPAPTIALRGNHEATLLNFLDDADVLDEWRHYGGLETLVSYGVDVRNAMRGRDFELVQEKLLRALPEAHREFYMSTKLAWSAGPYFFCHAGVKPGVALAKQSEHDLMWIREEFHAFPGPFEKVIVHGHTPVTQPEDLPHRINVDTGAYATDILTCVVLEGRERRFIST